MKRKVFTLVAAIAVAMAGIGQANAQIKKGTLMLGSDLANIQVGLNKGSRASITLNPKVGYFVQDGLAVGADLNLHFEGNGVKGSATTVNYGLGVFGRYYIADRNIEFINRSHFFVEANAGVSGLNVTNGGSLTNGLGLGFGPGFTYFITDNIGLEALAKYNGVVGFGSAAYQHNLSLNIGFQIYLPSKSTRAKVKSDFGR